MLTDFQRGVGRWMRECFQSPDAMLLEQRAFRMLEEAIELAQACGISKWQAQRLVDYVHERPAGVIEQEVGGVMVTVAGICEVANLTLDVAAERELRRCIANTEKIRAKDLTKPARSPLPGDGS